MRKRILWLLLALLALGGCGQPAATTTVLRTEPAPLSADPATVDERLIRLPDDFSWDVVDLEALSPG